MIYVSQIIMLYTSNFYSAACQLYLNKTGKKKKKTTTTRKETVKKWLVLGSQYHSTSLMSATHRTFDSFLRQFVMILNMKR